MAHVSGEEFCVMPKCRAEPHDLIAVPLCARHAMRVYGEMKELAESRPVPRPAVTSLGDPSPRRNSNREPGSVYFMRIGQTIKIGFSTNVKQRARALGADEVLATMPGTRALEKTLHAKFGPYWLRGEYYEPAPELLAYIAKIKPQ